MASTKDYTYREAGFNRFFHRSLSSNAQATSLRSASVAPSNNQLNFDNMQVSGSLGDTLKVGLISLQGKIGRISLNDELGTETLRLGNLDNG